MHEELSKHPNCYLQETPWWKRKCKAEVWLVFVRAGVRMRLLISQQRAESSRPGSTGAARSVNIYPRRPASLRFSPGWFPVRGNSLLLRINHTDTPRHLGGQGEGGALIWQEHDECLLCDLWSQPVILETYCILYLSRVWIAQDAHFYILNL